MANDIPTPAGSPNGLSRRKLLGNTAASVASAAIAKSAQAMPDVPHPATNDLTWLPAWRVRELFVSRKLSPLEFARHTLARVEAHSRLGAFITVFPDHLIQEATKATERKGADLPLLHGLPVSMKDTIFTKGQRTTMGSLLFKDHVPQKDSVAAEQIRKHGGIIFAKSNTPEFAMNRRSLNNVSREAVNPWDTRRTSGGSSGGGGVAAAAGLGPLAVGTDGGGSVRLPAAFNGVFGLCPSEGRIPDGADIFSAPSSRIGPLTRDVRDSAMLLQAMAVPDSRDPFSMKTPAPDYLAVLEDGVKGVRMAWSSDFGRVIPEEPEIVPICHDAAKTFARLGAHYSEPSLRLEDTMDPFEPDPEYSMDQVIKRNLTIDPNYRDSFTWIKSLSPEEYSQLTIYVKDRTDRPTLLDYALSINPQIRYRSRIRLGELFKQIDLLLSPTITRRAFICGAENVTPWQYIAYTHIVNSSGYCAASVPAGFYKGMPVGLQIMGRPGEEALVLRAARALERERPWADKIPPI